MIDEQQVRGAVEHFYRLVDLPTKPSRKAKAKRKGGR